MVPAPLLALFLVLLIIAIFGWTLSWIATRLDRLHARVESARAALDAQLVRRGSVALELATSHLLDPATAVLVADAAHAARDAPEDERELAESQLTQALVAALDVEAGEDLAEDELGEQLLRELAAACSRVTLALHFLNDAVTSVHALRRTRTVRWFKLAGYAALPVAFEMDDTQPAALRDG